MVRWRSDSATEPTAEPASEPTAEPAALATDNEAAARRLIDELWNKGNLSVADEIVHPDVVGHDPALPEEIRSPSDLKQAVSGYRAAFPDLRFIIDDLFSAGDKVIYRWHTEGTHTGELQGLAPTGKSGSVTGINIDRFVDGKVAESWAQWDNLGLMQQLGAVPARGSRGEKLGVQAQRLSVRAQEARKRLQERRQQKGQADGS